MAGKNNDAVCCHPTKRIRNVFTTKFLRFSNKPYYSGANGQRADIEQWIIRDFIEMHIAKRISIR